jgi:class 3 adenylate cyclase
MRRFDQFIRHRGHFGKSPARVNQLHQIRKRVRTRRKTCVRERDNSCPVQLKEEKMFGSEKDLRSRRLVAVFFAFISGVSAVSTAVLPGVMHI